MEGYDKGVIKAEGEVAVVRS